MKTNKLSLWKYLFLILLAMNLAFVGVVAYRVIQPREQKISQKSESKGKATAVKAGSFVTTREELNNTAAAFLEDYQSKGLKYEFYTTSSQVLFQGSYRLLGYEIPLYVYFEPYVLKNGDVQLEVTSVSAGTLTLPKKEILSYISNAYDIPDFLAIKPKKSEIILSLKDIKLSNGLYAKATEFDLANDRISFDLFKGS
ncbi:YpmS family protein [Streptococcus thoraltensis]|uniref:YpmS family protein n=1 Tax=Streptococcus thoraltensis TaxID=55085 RepID=UPI0003792ECD|nr:YpmS family protein [Streptococcus thoraltensis]MDY4761972.1 YpmS family protein [Streptococcus thoraltensis]